jgi:hypothetical protein
LRTSPQKKENKDPEVKPSRPAAIPFQPKGVKHTLELEEIVPRTTNYAASGKSLGQAHHGQDTKRRRTDEVEDKEMITSKPMRVSVVKQVHASKTTDNRIPNPPNPSANQSVNHIPLNLKKALKFLQHINISTPLRVLWRQRRE